MNVRNDKHFRKKRIWIDLDNSPHVPFFQPIIKKLEQSGYEVWLTGRDAYQVRELLKVYNLKAQVIGGHYGKNKYLKALGLFLRISQLMPLVLLKRPHLAVSHGSRGQTVLTSFLEIPTVVMFDYEHTQGMPFIKPDCAIIPEALPADLPKLKKFGRVVRYPGLKEEVYLPEFKPDGSILKEMSLNGNDIVVTIRPPATEAHYHNSHSEQLLEALIHRVSSHPNARGIILPRNDRQANEIKQKWANLFNEGKLMIPRRAYNGLNLIWHSDIVVSGGGTMNREAAALGVPVYSIFRGAIGAIDKYLESSGRLVLLEKPEDVYEKMNLERRKRSEKNGHHSHAVLDKIVGEIIKMLEEK